MRRMTLRRAATLVLMGFVAGVIAYVGVVLQSGLALLALSAVAVITGWGLSDGARWGRNLGFLVAGACAIAGLIGLYGLVAIIGNPGTLSRSNLAVLTVLLLMAITSVALLFALPRKEPPEQRTSRTPWPRLSRLGLGFAAGIGGSALFAVALSRMAEPPCCPL